MEFVVEPWHWFVLGILLILSELILPAFAALWFGIAAVMVCILLWLFPMMGFTTQVVTWGILSILCTILWFKFIKPLSTDKTKAGLPREATIGQVGMVIRTGLDHDQIVVRFQCLYWVPMNGIAEPQRLFRSVTVFGSLIF
jgi:membrane protein implicated in regulation of membrane protease activity